MDRYVTGQMIRRLREERGMTQASLAERLHVSDKAVSRWETGRGYPDITLLEPLSRALGLTAAELLAGECVTNRNRAFNMRRIRFHVCPVCGNVIVSTGDAAIGCCGITLPALEADEADAEHAADVGVVEDEYYVTLAHDMTKEHYISFIAGVGDNGYSLVKLYPEGPAEARVALRRTREIYCFCNRHGLYRLRAKR